ncbi:MAG: hypothetical protein D6730_03165 [Bacteroidetes bacterium]|nr:MAG: hypothetical protein D6730_03165 [Bacteroidota bacterium]
MPDFTHLRRLVEQGKIREAMGMLKDMSRGSGVYEEVLRHYARNTELEDQLRHALISLEEASKSRERIRAALFALIHQLEQNEKKPGGQASGGEQGEN